MTHQTTIIPFLEIRPRIYGDTRQLNIAHVFDLAFSIEAMGLIEPLVIDRSGVLLAGGHRLAALGVLNPHTRSMTLRNLLTRERSSGGLEGENRAHRLIDDLREGLPSVSEINFEEIPVRVFDFLAEEDQNRAIEVEIAENGQRRDYTAQEVLDLYHVLLAKGYTDPAGRPRVGERAVKPMIAALIGKSVRTVRRKLERAQVLEARTARQRLRDESLKVIKSIQRVRKLLSGLEPELAATVRASIEWESARDGLSEAMRQVDEIVVDEVVVDEAQEIDGDH